MNNVSINTNDDEIAPLMSYNGSYSSESETRNHVNNNQQRGNNTDRRSSQEVNSGRTSANYTDRRLSQDASNNRRRQPIQYQSINNNVSATDDFSDSAVLSRYKYYTRLAPHSDSSLQMPDHVVPENFFAPILITVRDGQNSIVTIFSLWNTMMGTSLLSMPWAIRQAGFVTGIVLLVAMAGIMLYTSYRILKAVQSFESDSEVMDFSDVCKHYLGKWAQVLAVISSLLTLLGGAIIYWILMSNFLYNVVSFIYHKTSSIDTNITDTQNDYICPGKSINSSSHGNSSFYTYNKYERLQTSVQLTSLSGTHTHKSTFDEVWDEFRTVPLFLIVVLVPIINFKSPTFFTKFNALGTISVTYLVTFVAIKASQWGIHLDFSLGPGDELYIPDIKGTFPALTGVAALAYFVQNCVISIVRNQKHPENNERDLTIAYILVALTYIYMGVLFYAAFPLNKDCIEDNLLNNLEDTDVLAFVARIGLFFQMVCVFPLLLYIFRAQFLHTVFGSVWPSVKHVLILNLVLVCVCIVFAEFLPHIGKIISFVGAFCGFSYAIALPCLVYLTIRHQNGTLTVPITVVHSFLIFLGLANFIGQFVILGVS